MLKRKMTKYMLLHACDGLCVAMMFACLRAEYALLPSAMVLTGTMVRVARRLNGKKTSGNG